jgi:hypothetical protein
VASTAAGNAAGAAGAAAVADARSDRRPRSWLASGPLRALLPPPRPRSAADTEAGDAAATGVAAEVANSIFVTAVLAAPFRPAEKGGAMPATSFLVA